MPRCWRPVWWGLLTLLAPAAQAGEPRDIVFECPCHAEWTAPEEGETGTLALTFGVRSFRATESGELRLARVDPELWRGPPPSRGVSVGSVPGGAVRSRERRSIPYDEGDAREPIGVLLWERAGQIPASVPSTSSLHWMAWRRPEMLVLWPVGDLDGEVVEFVDMLTDTDGDGVADVNEELAGTSRTDPASIPGVSTVDVLALYNDGFGRALHGYPYTQIHHTIVFTNAVYRDNGTNMKLRMVGAQEVELDASGLPSRQRVVELLDQHGADLSFRFHGGDTGMGCPPGVGGCASIGGVRQRGYWRGDTVVKSVCRRVSSVVCAAHELGHNLGLAHSARQGETYGAFRWSRGHYVNDQWGTIMSYGRDLPRGAFSDPAADCEGVPCGVPATEPAGAHAVKSLDLIRFQVVARRAPKPDTDGDGIVDVADGAPDDPAEWVDLDGDGIGDLSDPDDDGDGVADEDDLFPHDPTEWEDMDDDGVGDNADDIVADLSPFRDAALRAAVERALGKEAGAPITAADLATMTWLTVRGQEIHDLTGLDLAENLQELDLLDNEISDLSPIARLSRLRVLALDRNQVTDLSPLANAPSLEGLFLADNPISDLSTLLELPALQRLSVGGTGHGISDLTPLGELKALRHLLVADTGIPDLSLLSGLTELTWLVVRDNPVADLSPLRGMRRLWSVDASGTLVEDLSPLSELNLGALRVSGTNVSLDDVLRLPRPRGLRLLSIGGLDIEDLSALAGFSDLESLDLSSNLVSDLSPLAGLDQLRWLRLTGNRVSDVGPLVGLSQLGSLNLGGNEVSDINPLGGLSQLAWLNLSDNRVSDIGPLADRDVWNLDSGNPTLSLYRNPLDERSRSEHIPKLESWGIAVYASTPRPGDPGLGTPVELADPVLRALVARARARAWFYVDDPITEESLENFTRLVGFNAGVSNLAGLGAARNLEEVFLGSNLVSDLTSLGALENLEAVDLSDNLVEDIAPLVENPAIDGGDWITLTGNPLSEESLNVHVPALLDRGVHVGVDSVRLLVAPDTRAASFDVSGYFDATAGAGGDLALASDSADGVEAELADGTFQVSLGAVEGPRTVTVTATATDSEGTNETLAFDVSIRQVLPLFPSAATTAYQGFVRVTNHSAKPGRAVIHATDDEGVRHGPVTLSLGAHATAPFNSQDLEHGNAAKGLSDGVGAGSGDWRLDFGSNLDIEVLGYARTADGFVTTLHELAPRTGDDRTLPFLNPGSNTAQVSRLRLVNAGGEAADVSVTGVDDQGGSPGGAVRLSLAPGATRTLTAADLEAGEGATGTLGDGAGKWRLVVASRDPVYAMSLLESPTGHLTNLSSGPVSDADGTHTVPLFPASGDPTGRQGFVRVVNRADRAGTVTIAAIDDAGQHHGSATLALAAGATAPFNSNDLERGNPDKGLTGGVGAGSGDWRLTLTADIAIDVYAYIRHTDGFVTSMHDAVPVRDTHHRIGFMNPGGNRAQVSSLRLINPGMAAAEVTITARDDVGESPDGTVRLTIPAGAARTYTAAQLEEGAPGLTGTLGDGAGKWRLTVHSSEPIAVMSVLASPTGHLTNLSTAPMR